MRLRLVRGDISRAKAGAIITSANDALIGNENPLYWRFTSRKNVDGAVREAAGPGLRAACLALPEVEAAPYADEEPRDISRWAETAKRGASATLRCAPGAAVATRAFGLEADWCVHAVAPDSEFGYEGHYQGMPGIRGEEVRARSRPPLARLRGSYESALDICREVGASSVAVPALGAGVKGWRPAISAAILVDALCRKRASLPADVDVFLGSDDAWVAFGKSFRLLLGAADEAEDDPKGPVAWRFDDDDARLPYDAAADTTVDLSAIPDLRPRPRRKNAGYAGDHWAPTDNGWG